MRKIINLILICVLVLMLTGCEERGNKNVKMG